MGTAGPENVRGINRDGVLFVQHAPSADRTTTTASHFCVEIKLVDQPKLHHDDSPSPPDRVGGMFVQKESVDVGRGALQ
mgnify:CR=1 FL=1